MGIIFVICQVDVTRLEQVKTHHNPRYPPGIQVPEESSIAPVRSKSKRPFGIVAVVNVVEGKSQDRKSVQRVSVILDWPAFDSWKDLVRSRRFFC